MRTVGEILKTAREKSGFSHTEIEKETKIRTHYLEAVEKNDFTKIPGGAPTTKGFIKNYAEFLGLSSRDVLAVFRRDFKESKTGKIIPQGYYEPLGQPKFSWNPKLTIVAGIVALILVFAGYLFYQLLSLLAPPRLMVNALGEGAVVTEAEITLSGSSDPDASVFINDELITLTQEGEFQATIGLFPGENTISVKAVSRRDKETKVLRKVKYEPSQGILNSSED